MKRMPIAITIVLLSACGGNTHPVAPTAQSALASNATSAAVSTPAIADDQTAVSKAQAGASAERRERRPPARVQEQREARDRVRLTFPPPRR